MTVQRVRIRCVVEMVDVGWEMFQSRKCADLQIIWKGPSVGWAGKRFWPSERTQYVPTYLVGGGVVVGRYSKAVYRRHVARGLWPGPRVHGSTRTGTVSTLRGRDSGLCPAGASQREDPPPPHIRRRGTCWAGRGVLWALGTHEDEERRALGKVDLLQTAERSQCRGAGVMDRRSCTQDGVAAGQQGLPQRRLPSRLAPGARCCRLRGEGLGSIPRYCRNRLAGFPRSRRCLSLCTAPGTAVLLCTACDYLPVHS